MKEVATKRGVDHSPLIVTIIKSMAYHEIRNDKDLQVYKIYLADVKMPFKVQTERMYNKGIDYVQMNKFFHGVIVRSYMKHTGYTFFKSKRNLLIMNACVGEIPIEYKDRLSEYEGLFHFFEIGGVIFITERISKMTILRLNEFIDQSLIDLDDEGVKVNRNEDYKHESEINLIL